MYRSPNDLAQEDAGVRDAVRHGAAVAAVGVAYVLIAAGWVSTCDGATADTAACGPPQRALLALGAPLILLMGGLWAFIRAYQTWRRSETSWAWQGAGWVLLSMMALVGMLSVVPLAGTAVLGP